MINGQMYKCMNEKNVSMSQDSVVLAKEWTHISMEQNREPINKPHEYSQLIF